METPTSNYQLAYTPALDGIRGIAVLLVIAFHTGLPALSGGFVGVDVFFVLSGFLITSILIGEYTKHGKINFKHFYIRRALRLFPALALLVIAYIVVGGLVVEQLKFNDIIQESLYTIFYIANIVLAFGFDSIVFLGHAWSLSMEEQFYLLWPLLLLVSLKKIPNRYVVFAGITVLAFTAWAYRVYALNQLTAPTINRIFYGPDTRADGLLVGCAVALLLSTGFFERLRSDSRFTRFLSALALLALAGLLYIATVANIGDPNLYIWQLFALEFCVAVIILDSQCSEKNWLSIFLELPVLTWIGKISYGLYLWHFLVFSLLASQGVSPVMVLLIGIPLTFVISTLSFYLVEKRFLALRHSFSPGS